MIAIISITEQGNRMAQRLSGFLGNADCYSLAKYAAPNILPIEGKFKDFCGLLFAQYNHLVFIMAAGIVVRSIAPHLKSKTTDPAVVVLDEMGKNVISLLSGHLGGANALASNIAKQLSANAVITTASDVQKLPAVDMLAQKHGLAISSMEDAKQISSLIVNRKNILVDDAFAILPLLDIGNNEAKADGKIIVTNRLKTNEQVPFVRLIPKNIILGMGCRKDTPIADTLSFIKELLNSYHIDPRSIKLIASIDIKLHEPALLACVQAYYCKFICYTAQELQTVAGQFKGSAFVQQQVGVQAVSAPAAYMAGKKKGKFICEKAIQKGITISIFEER